MFSRLDLDLSESSNSGNTEGKRPTTDHHQRPPVLQPPQWARWPHQRRGHAQASQCGRFWFEYMAFQFFPLANLIRMVEERHPANLEPAKTRDLQVRIHVFQNIREVDLNFWWSYTGLNPNRAKCSGLGANHSAEPRFVDQIAQVMASHSRRSNGSPPRLKG